MMWKIRVLRSLHKVSQMSDKIGIGRLGFVQSLKRHTRQVAVGSLTEHGAVEIKIDGIRFYVYHGTEDFHSYADRAFEPYTVELFKRSIKPGATVLDVGAQFGFFTLLAARQAGRAGKVYAFEPAAANYKLLQRNVQVNGYSQSVRIIQKAAGKRRETVPFFVYEASDSHGMYRHPQALLREEALVECVTVDEVIEGRGADVIKMDIEGNEPCALDGMKQTISRSGDLVLIAELAPAYLRRAGFAPEDYLAKLEELGFSVRAIDERTHTLLTVSPEFLRESEQDPTWCANLYCRKASLPGTRLEQKPT
jgi:FkbM family methyltransferase